MISFTEKNKTFRPCDEKMRELYSAKSSVVNALLSTEVGDKVNLGYALLDLWRSNSYCTRAEEYTDVLPSALLTNCHQKIFFAVCEYEFGLDKSQVSRHMNVVDEFCQGGAICTQWAEYKWSLLVEMLPLTPEERAKVQPDWTVRQLRDFKKSFNPPADATSQQAEPEEEVFKEPSEFKDLSREDLIRMIYRYRADRYRLYRIIKDNDLKIETMESGKVDDFDFNAEYPAVDLDELMPKAEEELA